MAKKEIVELPDKHTGDIQEIRDKQIALASDATGASDITSQCEYLIKNGQTGEFMNVLKNYIDESIRNALGALVNNLDKGSSISKILATDASNDLGSITPANLASVLGVPSAVFHNWGGKSNFELNNTSIEPGIYYGTFKNAPSNPDGFLIQLGSGSTWYCCQIYITDGYPVGKMHVRCYTSSQWYNWIECN